MSISTFAAGLWFVLTGCIELFHLSAPSLLMGVLALVAGILMLVGDRVFPKRV